MYVLKRSSVVFFAGVHACFNKYGKRTSNSISVAEEVAATCFRRLRNVPGFRFNLIRQYTFYYDAIYPMLQNKRIYLALLNHTVYSLV